MQRISESELILNDRGAIYHLDLLPEELAPTIITVDDPNRLQDVTKYLNSIEHKSANRGFVTTTGMLGNQRVSVISTGIGPDNIDIVLNELDALANIDFKTRTEKQSVKQLTIIRIGTAISLQDDIPIDSAVVSTHGLGMDNLLTFYRTENSELEQQILQQFVAHTQLNANFSPPYINPANTSLLKHFVEGFHPGITVTCPGFYGPQGRVLRLGLSNPELINHFSSFQFGQHRIANFEMETSALYGLGKLLGHQCLSISAIVANRIHKTFSKDSSRAVELLIQKCLNIISKISS
ncbi:phosphorylase [Segetibacter sp. 3557_3]|uniref:nucleoside phosphorylase n=1 Tax=Segetibacter sp. 3557_3 TaxID=2547429 RepID=UPI001058FC9A|nr:nucleoside phosphorylase [Segetibacter sp. 3557_3]TDH21595.1 phosphorylase [Segetibacter sp. 3557_3]